MNHDDRTKKFTNAEFDALPRYENGRLIDLSMFFMWLTPAQIERLHSDDWAYLGDLEEEVRVMMQEFG